MSAESASIAPPRCPALLASRPTGRPSIRPRADAPPEPRPQLEQGTDVAERIENPPDLVELVAPLRHEVAEEPLVIDLVGLARRGEIGEVALGDGDRLGVVGDEEVDDTDLSLVRSRTDLLGPEGPAQTFNNRNMP